MISVGLAILKGCIIIGLVKGVGGRRLVGGPRKKWIDSVKECLKKRGLDVEEATRRMMVSDRNEWWKFVRGNAWGIARGMNP